MADGIMGLDPSLAGWGTPSFDTSSPMFGTDPVTVAGLDPTLGGASWGYAPTPGIGLNPSTAGSGWWNADPMSSNFFSDMNLGTLGNIEKSLGGMWDGASNFVNGLSLPNGNNGGSIIPGTMALTYAAAQPNLDLSNLNNIMGGLQGNQSAVVKAATDPLQQNIAAGYGDLLQSQALRGIRGSSFGDTDIANYLSTTGNALANAGANAAEGSMALQGDLATNIAKLQNIRQQTKNQLYGQAFDVLGRGMNPQGYTNNIVIGGGGAPTTSSRGSNAGIGALLGAGLGSVVPGVGTALGAGLGGIVGGLF